MVHILSAVMEVIDDQLTFFLIHIEYLAFPTFSFQKQSFKEKGGLFTFLRLLFSFPYSSYLGTEAV